MKPSRVLPLTLILATSPIFGQSVTRPAVPNEIADSCPVGMAVDRNGLFAKREVKGIPDSTREPSLEQHIQLNLTNRQPKTVRSAQITVHGLSQKARFTQVSSPQPDLAREIQLSLHLEGFGQSDDALWLKDFAVISAVDLNSVTYADGSTWREPSPAACSVAPSLLMRVDTELQR